MASHLYISAHSPINLQILQFIYIEKKVASSSTFRRVSSAAGCLQGRIFLKNDGRKLDKCRVLPFGEGKVTAVIET